jgi:hypothetical protein
MKFRSGNKIKYTQDRRYPRGIPSGVDFTVEPFRNDMWILTACGYGCRECPGGDCYGNGSLIAWGVKGELQKRFERELTRQRNVS